MSEEKKYVRKTLKTRDFKTAVQRAEEEYLRLYSDVAAGRKLFGINLGQLIALYLDWRAKDVAGGSITAGRLVTITSQLKHLRDYKGADTSISELDRNSLFDYAQLRRVDAGAQDVTIRNEQATINHIMKFAYRNGYSHFDQFEFAPIKIREATRRDSFSLEEYDQLVKYLRKWCAKGNVLDEQQRLERQTIRDAILIASNTMLRVGELWQLKWGDIVKYENAVDETGKTAVLITLNVRPEIAKTRKSRRITTRGGEYFKRLYEHTKFRGKEDYILCGKTGTQRFSRRKFYDAWAELMGGIGINHKERNLTWYSLRHFGITCRLRAGASVFDVASIAGTGVSNIQKHYGHFDQAMARSVALKNFTISKEGIIEKI